MLKQLALLVAMTVSLNAISAYIPNTAKGQASTTKLPAINIEAPNTQVTKVGPTTALIETGNNNILVNPSFEAQPTFAGGWTSSGTATGASSTATKIHGERSLQFMPVAQSVTLVQDSTRNQDAFADGVQGIAMVRVRTDLALKVCSRLAGVTSTTNCVTTKTDMKWNLYKVPVILGATSNGISIATVSNSTGQVNVDDAFLGATQLFSDFPTIETQSSYLNQTVTFAAATITGALTSSRGSGVYSYNSSTGVYTLLKDASIVLNMSAADAAVAGTIPSIFVAGVNVALAHSNGGTSQWTDVGYSGDHPAGTTFYFANQQNSVSNEKISVLASTTMINKGYSSVNSDFGWTDIPCSSTMTTLATTLCKYRRDGEMAEIQYKVSFTGATNATSLTLNMPTGLVIDTAKILNTGIQLPMGTGSFWDASASNDYVIYPLYQSSTQFFVAYSTNVNTGVAALSNTVPQAIATGDIVTAMVRVPIAGWEQSNVIIGQFVTTPPTITKLTSGSGTYTIPANVKYIKVKMVGGGGGGAGGGNSTAASAGGNTTFGTSLLTANGGGGGAGTYGPGAGGAVTVNSPAIALASLQGTGGGFGTIQGAAGPYVQAGFGGSSPFGGGGTGGIGTINPATGIPNTGSGGGGGGQNPVANSICGGGGGAGGYIEALINIPSSSYSYSIGGGGAGSAGVGTTVAAGAAGGSGVIIIEEYY